MKVLNNCQNRFKWKIRIFQNGERNVWKNLPLFSLFKSLKYLSQNFQAYNRENMSRKSDIDEIFSLCLILLQKYFWMVIQNYNFFCFHIFLRYNFKIRAFCCLKKQVLNKNMFMQFLQMCSNQLFLCAYYKKVEKKNQNRNVFDSQKPKI